LKQREKTRKEEKVRGQPKAIPEKAPEDEQFDVKGVIKVRKFDTTKIDYITSGFVIIQFNKHS
jgi:hypothetical protein